MKSCLSGVNRPLKRKEERFEARWYEKEEIKIFQGDNRFWEALLFDERIPDMLAVCAVENDIILGMASVTRDCEKMWQIGVNVTKEGAPYKISEGSISLGF